MGVKKKSKRGRKCKYPTHVQPRLVEIEGWKRDGLTDAEICKRLGVGVSAFEEYKKEFPELSEVLKRGKEVASFKVENSLYQRAIGATHERIVEKALNRLDENGQPIMVVEKRITEKLPPETKACIIWLSNMKGEVWKSERSEKNVNVNSNLGKMLDEAEKRIKNKPNLKVIEDDG